jgi:hypothetical protein
LVTRNVSPTVEHGAEGACRTQGLVLQAVADPQANALAFAEKGPQKMVKVIHGQDHLLDPGCAELAQQEFEDRHPLAKRHEGLRE